MAFNIYVTVVLLFCYRVSTETPSPTPHCREPNGYFEHEDPSVCDQFYFCVDGKFNMITCPDGLVYNENNSQCAWPDEAKKKICAAKDIPAFVCPAEFDAEQGPHPRFADPEDCQYFYVCLNGDTPRRISCKLGDVYDTNIGRCVKARLVPECKDWYKDRLTDAELDALENPPSTTAKPKRSKATKPSFRPSTSTVAAKDTDDIEREPSRPQHTNGGRGGALCATCSKQQEENVSGK